MTGAVRAFDAVAPRFDERFGNWLSVAAQRTAVRRELMRAFRPGSRVLELGGGTGDDALYLAQRGVHVDHTDSSDTMVQRALLKFELAGAASIASSRQLCIEDLGDFAEDRARRAAPLYDGVFSNFAAFNCVADLERAGAALSRLVRPGGTVVLVVFGPFCLGEIVLQLARGDRAAAFRRLSRGPVRARLGGEHFDVYYHRPSDITRAFAPAFAAVRKFGVGVLVPPSAAEPGISAWPAAMRALELCDRVLARPCALAADHLLIHLRRS